MYPNQLFVDDEYGRAAASVDEKISFVVKRISSEYSVQDLSRNKYEFTANSSNISINAYICASWCVGSTGQPTSSGVKARQAMCGTLGEVVQKFSEPTLTTEESPSGAPIVRSSRSRQRFFTTPDTFSGFVRSGDMCTLLRPQFKLTCHDMYPLIVSRFWKPYEGTASQAVMWIHALRGDPSPDMQPDSSLIKIIALQPIKVTTRRVQQRHQATQNTMTTPLHSNLGTLQDGRPYVVYRALLYCDDFKESTSPYSQSSAGGVYLLPIGMSLRARSSRMAVHVISLTPPGVSTNEILLDIISDIVKGAKCGVEGALPCGRRVVIFLDVLGFVADYPAAAAAIDVIGHVGDSPCAHCNIRKFKRDGASSLGYTTTIHAGNAASLRCGERHAALQQCEISDRDANILVMKPTSVLTDRNSPLLVLQRCLDAVRTNIPLNSEGVTVVPGLFDAFRSNLIAPDHLLTGLSRNVLDLCFHLLRREERTKFDIAICSALAENGLMRERSIYNTSKLQLHSTTLSTVYCVLLVSPPILARFICGNDGAVSEALRLLTHLKDLVAMTHWNPSTECDGEDAYKLLRIENGIPYQVTLRAMAEQYVSAVDRFWRRYPEAGSVLDKPNLHRLLELYHHTVPVFGHVSLVQELVFETAHQPLKRCISRGNHREAEVSAVEHCLGNDWQSRLAVLHYLINIPDEQERSSAMRGLRRLLLCREIETITMDVAGSADFLQKIDKDIKKVFVPALVHMLKSNGNVNSALLGRSPCWTTTKSHDPCDVLTPNLARWDVRRLAERGKNLLHIHTGHFGKAIKEVSIHWKARRVRPSGVAGSNTTRALDVLECGSVVQAIIRLEDLDNQIVRPHGTGKCVICVFVVVAFLEGAKEGPWALAVRFPRDQNGCIETPRNVSTTKVQLLLLTDGVRRVAVYHSCDYRKLCRFDMKARQVIHGESILSGGKFRLHTRKEGYPPRMA